ncbi:MAG: hypothetical protein CM1200mP25_4520 [Acidobacteriota bacterium]|nr:MAG: hypothetical protein CM1200mP25_4520 [Acidobacteriota bacterium]
MGTSPRFSGQDDRTTFQAAQQIAAASRVRGLKKASIDIDWALDRLLTNRWVGFPIMLLILAAVFWTTIEGANVPSAMLATLLIEPCIQSYVHLVNQWGFPGGQMGSCSTGFTSHRVGRRGDVATYGHFFSLFTLLEDFGYLPRVAFNLDSLFRRAAHMANKH